MEYLITSKFFKELYKIKNPYKFEEYIYAKSDVLRDLRNFKNNDFERQLRLIRLYICYKNSLSVETFIEAIKTKVADYKKVEKAIELYNKYCETKDLQYIKQNYVLKYSYVLDLENELKNLVLSDKTTHDLFTHLYGLNTFYNTLSKKFIKK